jgi:hypothetical protein
MACGDRAVGVVARELGMKLGELERRGRLRASGVIIPARCIVPILRLVAQDLIEARHHDAAQFKVVDVGFDSLF